MTIDETIKDLECGTEQFEMEIKSGLWVKGSDPELSCKEGIALNKQYIEWLTELKEAKRLLKSAAKIAKNLPCDDDNCSECTHNDNGYVCSEYEYFEWQYADAALKLIGEDEDVNT